MRHTLSIDTTSLGTRAGGRMPADSASPTFDYKRHFIYLICAVVVLVGLTNWRLAHGTAAPVALLSGLYGAVHSTLLVVTLTRPSATARRFCFVALATLASTVNVAAILSASRLLGSWAGSAQPALLLAMAAGSGAIAYTLLIRGFWIRRLTPMALPSIALCCVVASLTALASTGGKSMGGLWLAVAWWFAFSASLWCHDHPASAR